MKKALIILWTLLSASAVSLGSDRTIAIDSYKAVFDSRPVHTPTDKTADAPLAGNGDIGITMCSNTKAVRFFIGKNDFWKSFDSYPAGGIALPGWFDLSSKEIRNGVLYAEQLPGSACIKASWVDGDNCLNVKAWVAATENKIIIDVTTFNPTVLEYSLKACEDNGSKNESGVTEGLSWATREFKDDPRLAWPTAVAMALNRQNGKLSVGPGRHVFVISIYSNFDNQEYKSEAISQAKSANEASADRLWEEHTRWWENFWNLSHVNVGDKFIEKYYYTSQYLFACSSREGKFAPGLWGPFISCDDTAWAGDYHLNYNYQSPYWACYSSNQICLTDNYDKPILEFMDEGSRLAKTLLNCRGVYYPVGIGPFGYCSSAWPKNADDMQRMYGTRDFEHDCGMMFWGQKSNASFCAINMLMRFYGTWDKAYAEKVYPFIKACAEFWEDWLVFKDGRYIDDNDDFHEEPSWDGHKGDLNPTCSLGLIRMVMKGAGDMSRFLGVDKGCRGNWKDILENLSDFPTWKMPDGRVTLIDSETSGNNGEKTHMDYRVGLNRVMMHGILIPSGVCGPHLTPAINDIMLSDVAQWETKHEKGQDWGNSLGNGIETVYAGAARIGYPAEDIIRELKARISMQTFANGYIEAWGGGVETLAAVPFTINEMLLQSFEGSVRVFPNWIKTQDASFETLRAEGAFLVSSSLKDGDVEYVRIVSEQGRTLLLENPWPGCKTSVSRNGRKARTFSGDMLKIRTKAGQTLEIVKK